MRCEGGASAPPLLNWCSMDEKSKTLWKKVTATVNPLDGPRSPRPRPDVPFVEPNTLDLHGMTIQEAWRRTRKFLYGNGNQKDGHKTVTIITGKSGDIRREFLDWLDRISTVKSAEELNGGGAFLIKLKRSE